MVKVRRRKKIHPKFRKQRNEEPLLHGYSYVLWLWETDRRMSYAWRHFLDVLKEVDFPLYETLVEEYGKTFKAVRVCAEFFNRDFKRMFETKNWVRYGYTGI